jgi:YegS/Rv2252/BmrU family lipid kinase
MRALIICNPRAGRRGQEGSIDAAALVLERAGWTIDLVSSDGPGHVSDLAAGAAGEGMDAVLVAGGDGSLNEAVQGLAGTETALGYLPYGTVNIWAREIGLPLDPASAAHALLQGREERVDLGYANQRAFLLMAGVGLDGEVVRRARSVERHKQRFGIIPYVAVGLSTVPLYRGADIELRYDGLIRRVQALMLVVGNSRLYAGHFQLTPQAVINDGWLDLCIVKGKGPLAVVRQSLPLLLSRTITRSDVELLRVRDLTVTSDEPLPYQVDGELAGSTPVHITVRPRALRVIVPRELASGLIA